MGLMPKEFWSLTVREFWIKHAAFTRAEARARGLMMQHALMTGQYKRQDRAQIQKTANRLCRYPEKAWLKSRSN